MEFNIDGIQPELLKEMYESMVKIRKVEEKIGEVLLAGEVVILFPLTPEGKLVLVQQFPCNFPPQADLFTSPKTGEK